MMQSTASLEKLIADSEPRSAAVAWGAFVRYTTRLCALDYMAIDVSILVNRNIPVAWRVITAPTDAFYVDGEGGNTEKQWQAFARHLLSRCDGNNGYGIIATPCVMVHHRRPLVWVEASLLKLHPLEVSDLGDAGELIARRLYEQYLPPI